MANADPTNEDLNNYDFDSRSSTYYPSQTWNILSTDQMDNMQHSHDPRRHVSPIQTSMAAMRPNTMTEYSMMEDWQLQQLQLPQQQHLHQQQQQHHHHHHHHQQQQQHVHQHQHQHQYPHMDFDHDQNTLDISYPSYHNMTMPAQMSMIPVTQAAMSGNLSDLSVDQVFLQQLNNMSHNWAPDLTHELVDYTTQDVGMPVSPYQHHTRSPTDSHLEVLSQPSSSSNEDGGWSIVEPRLSFDDPERPYFVDPNVTLHDRTRSETGSSDYENPHAAFITNIDMSAHAVYSPTTLSDSDCEYNQHVHSHAPNTDTCPTYLLPNGTNTLVRSIKVPPSSKGSSPVRSPGSQGSAGSPGRKPTIKKSLIALKSTDRVQKKTSTNSKLDSTEKRVGRSKGPLSQEQRKQAGEMRKLRACIRCKFLKKACDKGEPCAGCQPTRARLWKVPCTRIDVKEIGYFLKDKTFDYEGHIALGFSVGNVKGFSDVEKTLFVTHGYGHMLPVTAREVYVKDEKCLKMDWIEANRAPGGCEVSTAKLSAGSEGISTTLLSDYLDRHIDIDDSFEKFVDDYFEGTPFLSQMLKVAFRFYTRTKSTVIKKALKLMLAYNLTLHITMVEGITYEEGWIGKIEDETSKFHGKTLAPVMINFQIKRAMADVWRELHKDVLRELSSLYSSVYSGDKLKSWPTIFILTSVLLAVWECMQFDCHYRVPDESAVDKFCSDMERTPVGVIVGLSSAISQKLPSVLEWDTNKHHALLGSDADVCGTMTEVRQHVAQYEVYLRERPNAKFDSKNFESLCNKFTSQLVFSKEYGANRAGN